MPLSGSRVIPAGWSEHHRPVAEGQMTATGSLARPPSGEPTGFNEVTGRSVYGAPTPYWTGAVRVQRGGQGRTTPEVGDRQATVREYQVSAPADVDGVRVNDQLTISACPDDPDLVDRVLRVVEVRYGSLLWQRDLVCEDTTPTSR